MHYDQLFPRSCPVQTADGFTRFQRLPPEIRNMIWEYALPEPRVYEVLDAPNAKQKTPAQEGLVFANVHPEPPPALAAVCRESRSFVLHHYKPLTLGQTTKFVDVSRDILLLEPYLLVKRLHRTLHFMSQIPLLRDGATRLALGTSYGIYPGIFHPVLGRKVSKNNMSKLLVGLAKFKRLRTLVFIVHQEFQFEFDFRFPGTLTPMPSYSALPPIAPSTFAPGQPLSHTAGVGAVSYPSPPASSGGGSPASRPSSLTSTATTIPPPAKTTTTTIPTPSPAAATATPLTAPPTAPRPTAIPPSSTIPQPLQPPLQPQPYAMLQPLPHTLPLTLPPPIPQPQPQQHHQQQVVHQAYRFKFDIESNINAPPRRPHTNELLYYPLEVREDWDDGDDYGYLAGEGFHHHHHHYHACAGGAGLNGYGDAGGKCGGVSGGKWDCVAAAAAVPVAGQEGAVLGGEEDDEGEESEWCDPWPTNDDWRRFRRRWVRAMVAACCSGSGAAAVAGAGEEGGGGVVGGGRAVGKGCEGWGEKGVVGKGRERVCLPRWRLKGASLLWRYTRGVGGVQ